MGDKKIGGRATPISGPSLYTPPCTTYGWNFISRLLFPQNLAQKIDLIQKIKIIFKAITQGEDRDFAAIGAPGVVIPRLALELWTF